MFKKEENKKLCENILEEIAQRHGIIIVEMAVMPDRIYLITDVPPTMSEVSIAITARTFLEPGQVLQNCRGMHMLKQS